MIVKTEIHKPTVSAHVSLLVCWLNHRPLNVGGKYIIRHTTDETRAVIKDVHFKVNINTLENIFPVVVSTVQMFQQEVLNCQKPDFQVVKSTYRLTI